MIIRPIRPEDEATRMATIMREAGELVLPGFTLRTDALHSQAGQVLHRLPQRPQRSTNPTAPFPKRLKPLGLSPNRAPPHWPIPMRPSCPQESPDEERLARGSRAKAHGPEPRGNSAFNGGHSALTNFWCQEKNTTRNCGKVAAVKNMVCVPGRAAGPGSRVLKCVQSQEAEAVRKSDHAA